MSEPASRFAALAETCRREARRTSPLFLAPVWEPLPPVYKIPNPSRSPSFPVCPRRRCPATGVVSRWATGPASAVLLFEGRLHYYEGYPWELVVQPIQIAAALGRADGRLDQRGGRHRGRAGAGQPDGNPRSHRTGRDLSSGVIPAPVGWDRHARRPTPKDCCKSYWTRRGRCLVNCIRVCTLP